MHFAAFLLIFAGGGLLVSRLSGRDFGQGLPVFLLGGVAVLYAFGLAGVLVAGVWALGLAGAAGFALLAAQMLRQKSLAPVQAVLASPALWGFLFLLVFIFFVNQNRNFVWMDEYSFWGLAVKEQVRLDALYNLPASAVTTHRDYPPAVMLFQYFWCKVAGGYSEVSCYRALQFFTLSLMLPALSFIKFKGRRKWGAAAGLLCLVLVLHTFSGVNLYASIYIDATMGVLIGYVVALAAGEAKLTAFGGAAMALGCFVACLAKSMGVLAPALACLYLLVVALGLLWQNHRALPGEKQPVWALVKSPVILAGLALGGTLAAKISWNLWRSRVGAGAATFDTAPITPAAFFSALAGRGSETQQTVLRNFSANLVGEATVYAPLSSLTFLQAVLLVALLGWAVWRRYRADPARPRMAALAVTLPAGLALYALVMLALYLFSFTAEEAVALASYARYMGTGVVCATTALLLVCARFFTRPAPEGTPGARGALPWGVLALAVLLYFTSASTYVSLLPVRREDSSFSHMAAPAAQIAETLDPAADKLYVLADDATAAEYTALRYYLAPLPTASSQDGTARALEDGGYSYLYLGNIDEELADEYAHLVDSGVNLTPDGLYRVVRDGDATRLELVQVLDVDRGAVA